MVSLDRAFVTIVTTYPGQFLFLLSWLIFFIARSSLVSLDFPFLLVYTFVYQNIEDLLIRI